MLETIEFDGRGYLIGGRGGQYVRYACQDGRDRFFAAHPEGKGDIYSVWPNDLHVSGRTFNLLGDVSFLASHCGGPIFNAVLIHAYYGGIYVNCHILEGKAEGTFFGCTFADGVFLGPDAEVIE